MSKKSKRKAKTERPGSKKSYGGIGWLAAAFVGVAALFVYFGDEADSPPSSPSRPASSTSAPPTSSSPPARPASSDPDVPPFHESADEAKPFPKLQDPSRYEIRVVARAYRIAHEIPEVLAQQPCYCNCGVFGHGSLLDCWASDHGAT